MRQRSAKIATAASRSTPNDQADASRRCGAWRKDNPVPRRRCRRWPTTSTTSQGRRHRPRRHRLRLRRHRHGAAKAWTTCRVPGLHAELLRRGYGGRDVKKILGGNVLRVMREAEAVAAGGCSCEAARHRRHVIDVHRQEGARGASVCRPAQQDGVGEEQLGGFGEGTEVRLLGKGDDVALADGWCMRNAFCASCAAASSQARPPTTSASFAA